MLCVCLRAAATRLYTLSLHDALPISLVEEASIYQAGSLLDVCAHLAGRQPLPRPAARPTDRKSTRLNSSHRCTSYAVFCLKKKKQRQSVVHTTNRSSVTPNIRRSQSP